MSRAWLIGTPLPPALADEGRAVVDLLRSETPTEDKAERAFAFVYAASERSVAYHFREPLAALGVGVLTRKALDVALKGIRRGLGSVLRGLDEAQLRGVADAIEVRLYPDPHAPDPG